MSWYRLCRAKKDKHEKNKRKIRFIRKSLFIVYNYSNGNNFISTQNKEVQSITKNIFYTTF